MGAGNPAMQNHLHQDPKNKPRGSNPDTSLRWLSNPSNNTTYKLHSTIILPRTHPEKTLKRKPKEQKTQFNTSHKPSQPCKSKQNQ